MKNKAYYKEIFDEYFEEFDTSGLIVVNSFLGKQAITGHIVYFEVEKWKNSDSSLLDYTYIVIDDNDNVIYDEADGSLPISTIKKRYHQAIGMRC